MQQFDRNNFKSFAAHNQLAEKKKWLHNHSEIVQHRLFKGVEYTSSFKSVSASELTESYLKIGSLRDNKIKTLDYIECNDKPDDFWNPESKIATNFYPYHNCDVYSCRKCNKLFLVYTEYGGHGPDLRMRAVKPALIIEEPANCTLKIPDENIPYFLSYLQWSKDEFAAMLEDNKDLRRIDAGFDNSKIIVKRKWEDLYLIISSRAVIYDLIDRFQ